jgi:hypothetical protein
MSEKTDEKCYKSTPAKDLEDRIMNSNIPKSEAEWWACNEIERLRERLALIEKKGKINEQQIMDRYTKIKRNIVSLVIGNQSFIIYCDEDDEPDTVLFFQKMLTKALVKMIESEVLTMHRKLNQEDK